eukprot:SAG31_NODE_4465_length_3209_cov_4.435691_3_plen_115_part_00
MFGSKTGHWCYDPNVSTLALIPLAYLSGCTAIQLSTTPALLSQRKASVLSVATAKPPEFVSERSCPGAGVAVRAEATGRHTGCFPKGTLWWRVDTIALVVLEDAPDVLRVNWTF